MNDTCNVTWLLNKLILEFLITLVIETLYVLRKLSKIQGEIYKNHDWWNLDMYWEK